jgi:hypothetical protein
MALHRNLLRAILAGGIGSGPIPVINLDLTSALDSRITFTRAGTRNYITNGVLTALATGQPAFESWGGVNRGMAVEPAFTNLITYSNAFANAAWQNSGTSAAVAGDAGSGVMTQLSLVAATATANYHQLTRTVGGLSAGSVHTWQGFAKVGTAATNYSCFIAMSDQYDNNGARAMFRLDGNDGFWPIQDTTRVTNATFGFRKLTGGVYQIWITGTWVNTGSKDFTVGVSANTAPDGRYYTAPVTDKVQLYGFASTATSGPTGYVDTTAATVSQAAESAIFNDTSWLTTTQGTFVIEHDCRSGTLVGSGANTVLGATVPGRSAIAWGGTTSDTVVNGGATTAGGIPTFGGSDIRLLATTVAGNTGHIKSIKFYNTRLTVAQLQVLTSPTVVSTATPGVLRGVSVDNRLPAIANVTTGTALTFTSRFRLMLGSFACSEIRTDFANIRFAGSSAVGNAVTIDSAFLERITGVAESVQLKVSGATSFVVPDGANTTLVSDAVLPGAFTSLTTFPADTEIWVRVQGHVTLAGHILVGSRQAEPGSFCKLYDPATVTYSPTSGTGPITVVSGTDVAGLTQGFCPILVGKFVTGDPKTLFVVGDSIDEGVGSIAQSGTFIRLSARNLGLPMIDLSLGGQGQNSLIPGVATWTPYLKYARVLVDEMGTNSVNAVLDFFGYWRPAKTTYAMDKIVRIGLFPRSSSTDSFATEINQTSVRAYPTVFPDLTNLEWLKAGLIDANIDPQSVRGVDKSKWISNGTAFYGTVDGTHQSTTSNNLLTTEIQPLLAAIAVT